MANPTCRRFVIMFEQVIEVEKVHPKKNDKLSIKEIELNI